MLAIAPGWELEVERGPDWLIVRIQNMDEISESSPPLAERIWELMQQHLTHRLVLELDQVPLLNSYLIGQLIQLYRVIREHYGVMRLCGLSAYNQEVLQLHGLEDRFPSYGDVEEAVMCSYPLKPR